MATPSRRTQGLKTQQHELVKQFVVFDIAERPIEVYTAHTDAAHGTPCTVIYYEYINPTSSLILKMKEDTATWDSAWDI